MQKTTRSVLTITPAAEEQINHLLSLRDDSCRGLRIGIKTHGCSGLSYDIRYSHETVDSDEVVEVGNAKVFIDRKAVMYLIGSVMDYKDGIDKSGFVFTNPNESGRCGCGKSFTV